MAVNRDTNYLINTVCPHCKAKIVAAISGFAGELAVRSKTCPKCEKEYFLHIFASTSTAREITDGETASLRLRIKYLREQKVKQYHELLIEADMAEKINEEALAMAKEMHRKRQMN